MKLELKHLTGYFPYELECKTTHSKYKDSYKLIGIDFSGCIFKNFELFYFRIKPILHPLSDLTKEIEVNGEKFVPIEKMDSLGWFNMNCNKKDKVLRIPYGMMTFLFEWHFDIYNLIENNLAIDKNTLL